MRGLGSRDLLAFLATLVPTCSVPAWPVTRGPRLCYQGGAFWAVAGALSMARLCLICACAAAANPLAAVCCDCTSSDSEHAFVSCCRVAWPPWAPNRLWFPPCMGFCGTVHCAAGEAGESSPCFWMRLCGFCRKTLPHEAWQR